MTMNASMVPSLSELNVEESKKYYGSIVFIGILFLPAVIGNSHILHIYIFKKKPSNTRIYVCFMAVLDMTNCLVCYPFHVVNNLHPYIFYSDAACKIFTYITYFVNTSVPLCLFIISIDRYKIICRPFGPQISEKLCKLLCVFIFIASFVISIPSSFMYGSVEIETGVDGVIGHECNLSAEFGSWSVIYIGTLSVLSTIEAIILIVLYSLMGLSIRKQQILLKKSGIDYKTRSSFTYKTSQNKIDKFEDRKTKTLPRSFIPSCVAEKDITIFNELRNANNRPKSESDSITPFTRPRSETISDNHICANNKQQTSRIKKQPENLLNEGYVAVENIAPFQQKPHNCSLKQAAVTRFSLKSDDIEPRMSTLSGQITKRLHSDEQPHHENENFRRITRFFRREQRTSKPRKDDEENKQFRGTKRVTYMFFWVTFIYVISYWPNPVLRVVRWFHEDWYDGIGFSGQVVYHIMIVSVFLVSATNFFIYLFFDSKFRRDVRLWYTNMLCRRQKCQKSSPNKP